MEVQSIFIAREAYVNGPPGGGEWTPAKILQFLRGRGIDAERFVNWTRAKNRIGIILYYEGEEPTEEKATRFLQ